MLRRLGSALVFVAGSVVGGLALAFLIVALRPELIRGATTRAPVAVAPPPPSVAPAAMHDSYAEAVQRAAPAVVNIYTARLVTERLAPSLGELFGEYMPRYRQRIERSLGSGVIVDRERTHRHQPPRHRQRRLDPRAARRRPRWRMRASWDAIRTPTWRY